MEGDKGASPARFSARLGPHFPCASRRLGCGVRPLFPGRAEEEVAIESGFGNGSRVSADWRVSEGVGVGRGRVAKMEFSLRKWKELNTVIIQYVNSFNRRDR